MRIYCRYAGEEESNSNSFKILISKNISFSFIFNNLINDDFKNFIEKINVSFLVLAKFIVFLTCCMTNKTNFSEQNFAS